MKKIVRIVLSIVTLTAAVATFCAFSAQSQPRDSQIIGQAEGTCDIFVKNN